MPLTDRLFSEYIKNQVSSPHHHKSRIFFFFFFLNNNYSPKPTFSAISQSLTVPSSAAERKKSLEGCVARPQIGPSIWPLIRMLHAAFFSPTSIISAFLVPTRIFPLNNSERTISDIIHKLLVMNSNKYTIQSYSSVKKVCWNQIIK